MQLKIGIILTNITKRAGIERAVVNLSNILSNLGYQVFILSSDSEMGTSAYNLNKNVEILHLGLHISGIQSIMKTKEYFLLYTKLIQIRKKKKINVFIGTECIYNFLISFISKIKTIGCEHFNYEYSGSFKNFLKKFFYKKLDSVVLLTESDKKNYNFLVNTCVIPNSLSFSPSKISDCETKRIISLGRLTYQKGYDLLIESINLIKDKLNGWIVEIYGSGEDRAKLEDKISYHSLNDIIRLKEPIADVENLFYSSSIFLSSSRFEGFSLVILESQSCGVPAVVFDCPCGPAEIVINDRTGFVVDLYDVHNFSQKILELVDNEQLRKEFGKNAHIEANRFSTSNISLKWAELFERIL